jgi:hypothetical protein
VPNLDEQVSEEPELQAALGDLVRLLVRGGSGEGGIAEACLVTSAPKFKLVHTEATDDILGPAWGLRRKLASTQAWKVPSMGLELMQVCELTSCEDALYPS